MHLRIPRALLPLLAALPLAALAQTPGAMVYKSADAAQYAPNPSLPACAKFAVQDGDPANGSAVFILKATAHCNIPWHWHTGNERLIFLSGSAKLEMKDMPASIAHKGDFVLMPAKGVHQFTSETDVEFYIVTDAPFDIHYVDTAGKELSPDQAIKKTPGL